MKNIFIIVAACCFGPGSAFAQSDRNLDANVYVDHSPGYTISAYYWPNVHVDPRNEKWFGPGWTEYEITKSARPRFPGHQQPKVPLWGYEDESDPAAMARKIDAAAKYGVDVLIFDWYYYNDGSFLRAALDKGFMGAPNNQKVKFALMWANHDMPDVFPAKFDQCYPDWRVLIPGDVTRKTFDLMVDDIIEKYFKHPSYWLVEGAPYFSVYDLDTLFKGLGSEEEVKRALADFRAKTKAAGFSDLHLNVILRGDTVIGDGLLAKSNNQESNSHVFEQNKASKELGFDSLGAYTWIHHVKLPDFPTTEYSYVRRKAMEHNLNTVMKFDLPYYANVTCGWDSTPRTSQSDIFISKGYPFMAVVVNNTPAEFKRSLSEMKHFLDTKGNKQKIFSINSWNEWTEGSYLEPDASHGFGFLEAVREVFGAEQIER